MISYTQLTLIVIVTIAYCGITVFPWFVFGKRRVYASPKH